jgi:protein-L-isoaspartate(D-aspartate) O-methyltransferase
MDKQTDDFRFQGLRRSMVLDLERKGIKNKAVLAAIGKIPRHFFLDSALAIHAYQDKPFPIGEGQTISQPFTVARQTELLEVKPGDRILEIGTGSGYQCSVLAELGAQVYTIEYQPVLFKKAQKMVARQLGYRAQFFLGDGSLGLSAFAPYDAILVTAGAPSVPAPLIEQLKPGGRLVIPTGTSEKQEMIRITKSPTGEIVQENFGQFSFVPLKGNLGWA